LRDDMNITTVCKFMLQHHWRVFPYCSLIAPSCIDQKSDKHKDISADPEGKHDNDHDCES